MTYCTDHQTLTSVGGTGTIASFLIAVELYAALAAIISPGTDGDDGPLGRQRHGLTEFVTSSFTVDILSNLSPSVVHIAELPHMP